MRADSSKRPPDITTENIPADTSGEFSVTPITDNCRRVYEEGRHIVVGVSHGNCYFSVKLLSELLRWSHVRFTRVDVVIPDIALRENLLVLGRSAEYAERKSRQETNAVRNRVVRALLAARIPPSSAPHVHLLSDLVGGSVYRALRERAEAALHQDGEIRRACLRMSRLALGKYLGGAAPTEDQVRAGIRYPLAELPFFLGSSQIFGVPSSLCFYHKPIPLADILFSRKTDLAPAPGQGYAVIRPSRRPSGPASRFQESACTRAN
ncbi:tRNA-dependent cyclodipeptide synthase [Streptomyces sp. ISL-100]|uniref:tRNA-dependent cyclodipeptide synthase n=1 Tax=Streptomyces sp. ISL-100 TaxID=2819173 RepID=UPI001BE7B744|nr:tRNA-dependent cyclodipeptide synthase [Streptomyces sp. ISL-100]MBT2401673.1 tRNA-dependent cyclodipeptide synthase [Streptomyces sp. ISL-100]